MPNPNSFDGASDSQTQATKLHPLFITDTYAMAAVGKRKVLVNCDMGEGFGNWTMVVATLKIHPPQHD